MAGADITANPQRALFFSLTKKGDSDDYTAFDTAKALEGTDGANEVQLDTASGGVQEANPITKEWWNTQQAADYPGTPRITAFTFNMSLNRNNSHHKAIMDAKVGADCQVTRRFMSGADNISYATFAGQVASVSPLTESGDINMVAVSVTPQTKTEWADKS